MNETVQLYEELTLNAHPALQTQFYDGWVLRFANGYTKRANSINVLYPAVLDLQTKINECEKRYSAKGLPTVFKLTETAAPCIDKALGEQGYSIVEPTYVMKMDLQDKTFGESDCILTDHASAEWLESYFSFSHYPDGVKKETAKQILDNVKNPMICGRIVKNGVSVACGLAVIERGYMGLLNVTVDENQRGKGYGFEICNSLLSAAKSFGAHTAYLQVVQNNKIAVNMYSKIGYRRIYSYWYRVKTEYGGA